MTQRAISTKQGVAEPTTSALWDAPYFIGLGRAMVSLGPTSTSRYCPFRCRFCYVQGPFPKYASASVPEVTAWLDDRRGAFSIIYVSGDTDSFAPPRTSEGLDLLEALAHQFVDVLFTTRHVFSEAELSRLHAISDLYRKRGLLLIGCISVSQLHNPALEPSPIQSPQRRVQTLFDLKKRGVLTALTIRPFIPSIPGLEYAEIASVGSAFADVVLGGDLYVDSEGKILDAIAAATGVSLEPHAASVGALDFSLDRTEWITYKHPEAEEAVRRVCEQHGKPFFMRSGGAIEWLRANRSVLGADLGVQEPGRHGL